MNWGIEFSREADEAFQCLPQKIKRQVNQKIESLRKDPLPVGSKKLHGTNGLHRIRSGDYRIVYQIREEKVVVLIVRIRHRRNAYRNLPEG